MHKNIVISIAVAGITAVAGVAAAAWVAAFAGVRIVLDLGLLLGHVLEELPHLFGQRAQPDRSEEVDAETHVLGVVLRENTYYLII